MVGNLHCPEDRLLWPLASGHTADASVRTHVENCVHCRERLQRLQVAGAESPTADWSPPPASVGDTLIPSTPTADSSTVGTPEKIGKYIVVAPLDCGGQAQVYRAFHPTLGKELVVKLGRSATELSSGSVGRLVEEGRILAGLDHPNLARVYDLDFHDGRAFIVMEYIPGRTLEQFARQNKVGPLKAAILVAKLARALAVAHRRGILHRDIKPKNILIDERGEPRLIDFGMARMHQPYAGEEEPAGSVLGTPGYMAPEQARGETDRIDSRADIFALGGVLYYLLTGKPLFRAPSLFDTLEQAGRCEFDRAALQQSGAPRRSQSICLRALAAEPEARYARAEDLARDLEWFARRPRARAVLIGGSLGLLLVVAIIAGIQRGSPAALELPTAYPHVAVFRANAVVDIGDAVPLRTGDRLRFECDVPRACPVALFWLDPDGNFTEEPTRVISEGKFAHLVFPAKIDNAVPLIGKPGTEMILVCAQRGGVPDAPKIAAFLSLSDLRLSVPLQSWLSITNDAVEIHGRHDRGAGAPELLTTGLVKAQKDVESLRQRFRSSFDFVCGVAFNHIDAQDSTR
jgi:tRNA A-37 threonylcarbamoyl transferase component Bud32